MKQFTASHCSLFLSSADFIIFCDAKLWNCLFLLGNLPSCQHCRLLWRQPCGLKQNAERVWNKWWVQGHSLKDRHVHVWTTFDGGFIPSLVCCSSKTKTLEPTWTSPLTTSCAAWPSSRREWNRQSLRSTIMSLSFLRTVISAFCIANTRHCSLATGDTVSTFTCLSPFFLTDSSLRGSRSQVYTIWEAPLTRPSPK